MKLGEELDGEKGRPFIFAADLDHIQKLWNTELA